MFAVVCLGYINFHYAKNVTLIKKDGEHSKPEAHLTVASDLSQADTQFEFKTKEQFYAYYANDPTDRWLKFFERDFHHECNFYQIDRYYEGRPTNQPKTDIDKSCYTPDALKDKRVLIWGDSHGQMLNYGLSKKLPQNWQILQIASSGCIPSVVYQKQTESDYCAQSNWFALKVISEVKPEVVLLAQSVNHSSEEMKLISKKLASIGVKRVIFVGPSPHWEDDLPKLIIRQLWPTIPYRTFVGIKKDFIALNTKLKKQFVTTASDVYADVIDLFCDDKGCLTRLIENDLFTLTTWDQGHLTRTASEYLADKLLVPEITKPE
jgi:hypothetical protein